LLWEIRTFFKKNQKQKATNTIKKYETKSKLLNLKKSPWNILSCVAYLALEGIWRQKEKREENDPQEAAIDFLVEFPHENRKR